MSLIPSFFNTTTTTDTNKTTLEGHFERSYWRVEELSNNHKRYRRFFKERLTSVKSWHESLLYSTPRLLRRILATKS